MRAVDESEERRPAGESDGTAMKSIGETDAQSLANTARDGERVRQDHSLNAAAVVLDSEHAAGSALLNAERALLGSVLIHADVVFPKVESIVGEEDFERRQHRWVWRVLVGLRDARIAVDIITVACALENVGRPPPDDRGWMVALIELGQAVTSTAHARHHAQIVRDAGQRRRLLALLPELAAAIGGLRPGLDSPAEFANDAALRMQRLLGRAANAPGSVE